MEKETIIQVENCPKKLCPLSHCLPRNDVPNVSVFVDYADTGLSGTLNQAK